MHPRSPPDTGRPVPEHGRAPGQDHAAQAQRPARRGGLSALAHGPLGLVASFLPLVDLAALRNTCRRMRRSPGTGRPAAVVRVENDERDRVCVLAAFAPAELVTSVVLILPAGERRAAVGRELGRLFPRMQRLVLAVPPGGDTNPCCPCLDPGPGASLSRLECVSLDTRRAVGGLEALLAAKPRLPALRVVERAWPEWRSAVRHTVDITEGYGAQVLLLAMPGLQTLDVVHVDLEGSELPSQATKGDTPASLRRLRVACSMGCGLGPRAQAWLARLVVLELPEHIEPLCCQALLSSLPQLERLVLGFWGGASLRGQAPSLVSASLCDLELRGAALTATPGQVSLPRLRRLVLGGCRVRHGAALLSALAQVRCLGLCAVEAEARGQGVFQSYADLFQAAPHLECLEVHQTRIPSWGYAQAPCLRTAALDLAGFARSGLVATSSSLPVLETLRLSGSGALMPREVALCLDSLRSLETRFAPTGLAAGAGAGAAQEGCPARLSVSAPRLVQWESALGPALLELRVVAPALARLDLGAAVDLRALCLDLAPQATVRLHPKAARSLGAAAAPTHAHQWGQPSTEPPGLLGCLQELGAVARSCRRTATDGPAEPPVGLCAQMTAALAALASVWPTPTPPLSLPPHVCDRGPACLTATSLAAELLDRSLRAAARQCRLRPPRQDHQPPAKRRRAA